MTDTPKILSAQREKLYQNLFTSMNEGLAICEIILDKNNAPYDYRYLEVNAAFEKIKGIPVEQVQGKTRREFGETDPHWLALFGQVVKTEKPASQMDFSPEYGKWLDLRAFPLGGKKFAFLLMDITERQQEQNFSQALNDINEIIYSKLKFDEIMNKIIIATVKNVGCETAAISLGRTGDWTIAHSYGFPEELITAPINRANSREERQELITELALTTKQPIIVHDAFSDKRVNRDQAKKWNIHSLMALPLIIEDQVIGAIFFNYHQRIFQFSPSYINFARKLATTISLAIKNAQLFDRIRIELNERKQAEEALRESREKYQALIETNVDFIWEMDSRGRYTYCSPQMEKLWGLKPAEMIGKAPFDVMIAAEKESAMENLMRMVNDPRPFNGLESTAYDSQGRIIFIETSGIPYFDGQGGLLGFRGITRDITGRKNMEEALRKSEENYRELVESSNSIILRVDKNLKITFINEFAQRFLGFTAAEIIGKPVVGTIIPPANNTGQNLAAMAEDIIRNPENYVNNVHQNTRKSGELVWISWTNKALYDEQGNLTEILSVGNDITDLKQMERTLEISQESEERLNALMNHNPSLVFLKDEEGRYVYLNDTYEKQFIGSKDWYGKTDFDFWPKESAELFRKNDVEVLKSGRIQQFLEDSTDLEGARYCWLCYKFPFTDSKNRRYLGGIGINATERIIAEEALKASEQKFKSMFESSPIDMALMSLEGTFIDLNQAALDLHGFSSKDELIGKNCLSLVDPDYHQEVTRRWEETIQNGSVENVELKQLKKDGQWIHTQVSATSLKDSEGKTYALLAMVQDITTRKKAEEALWESESNLRMRMVELNALVEVGLDGIIIYDKYGRVVSLNEFADRIFSFSDVVENTNDTFEERAAKYIWRFPDGKPLKTEDAPVYRALHGETIRDLTFYSTKGSDVIWLLASTAPLRIDSGEIFGAVASFKDITARKRAEEALQDRTRELEEANHQKEDILESISDCFYALDKDLRFIYVNKAAEEIWGLSRTDLIGHKIENVFASLIDISLSKFYQVLEEQIPLHYEVYSKVIQRWGDMSVYPTKDGISVYFRDTTQRKQAEEALKESEERLRMLTVASVDVVYRMSPDWSSMTELFGKGFLSDTEEPNANWLGKYIYPDDQEFVTGVINECIRERKTFELEHRVLRADSCIGWTFSRAIPLLDGDGGIKEWFCSTSDITERKKAQEALETTTVRLEQAYDLLSGVIENTTDLIAAIDTNFRYLAINEAYHRECQAIYGVDIHVGDNMIEILAPYSEDQKSVYEIFGPAFQGKSVVTTQIYGDPGKSRRFYELHVSPIHDSQGRIIGAAHINTDITERKQAEEMLRESEEKYRTLFENMTEMFQILEPILNEEGKVIDFRYIEVNKATEVLTGKKREEIEGKTAHELWGIVEDYWFEMFGRALKTSEPLHMTEYSKELDLYYDINAWKADESRVAIVFSDITERKKAEEVLRKSEERQAFLLKLSDTIRPLSDAQAIQDAATRLLADYLGASQSNYTEYFEKYSVVSRESLNDAEISVVGSYRLSDFPVTMATLYSDRDLVIPDVAVFPAFSAEERAQFLNLNIHANATAPLIKDGKLVATLTVRQTTPRNWTPEEVELVRETAERTWAAVVRVKAERALRESEEQLRMALAGAQAGMWIWDLQKYWKTTPQLNTLFARSISDPPIEYHEFAAMVHPEDRERVRKAWLATVHSNVSYEQEYRILWPDGSIHWLRSIGAVLELHSGSRQFLGISFDITERKQMEEELRESERQYRELVKYAPVGIYELDFRTMCLKSANDAMCLLTGYTKDELLGMNPFDLLDDEGKKGFQERTRKWLAGVKSDEHVTYKIKTKDGHEIMADLQVTFTTDEKGAPLGAIVIGQDITERQRIEKEKILLESYRRNNEILESITDSFYALDQDLRFIYVNIGAEKAWGISRSALINQKIAEIFPHLIDYSLEKFNRVLQEQTPEHYELYSKVTEKWVEMHVYPTSNGISVYFRDISERKQMENTLLESQEALSAERELLKVTLNSLGEGVLATDQDEKIILINETAAKLTGISADEAIGQPVDQILYLQDDKTSEPVNQIPTQATFSQFILCARDGRKMAISLSSAPIKTTDDQIIGTVIVFQDITEKQRTDRELLKTEKLESIGILAGGIAHDFNNLLGAILSNIQLAQMKYKKNANIEKYLQESVDSTRRASELTRQLLTFAKGGAPVKKAASLAEIVRDTATFALRGSNVKVEFRISESLWPAEADTGQISQVIHNLVINASQAMPKGGILQISAENITIEPGHRFQPGNYLKITVKDQGVGIPKENLSKIFDPFFTTKKEGSGLGLATSYSIIRSHDGYLEVDSEVGLGTTFFIYLPALMKTIDLPDVRNELAVTNQGIKILFMEDEEIILKSVGEMLEHYGHQVVLTTEGSKAIEDYRKAMEDGVPFDVVIMDLTIPGGMGGQEAIAYLRMIDPNIKAIVSSGYANDPILSEYERFGFCGVVTKPYRIDELNEVLYRLLERK